MSGTVCWVSIAPVKGMRIQAREEVVLNREGVPGDRAFFLVDGHGAMVNGKRFGRLMGLVPEHDATAGTLSIAFPDGSEVAGEVVPGEPESVTFFGNEVSARPLAGDFSSAISEHVGEPLRLMERPGGRPGVDRGKWGGVTLLGAASLASLREAARESNREADGATDGESAGGNGSNDPGTIDPRRFRMTFGIEGTGPYEEDRWVGREVKVGGALVKVGGHVGRCAVTTRQPDTGNTDLKTLHFLRFSRGEMDSFEALPFGVFGEVIEPGAVRLGDPVVPSADR